MKWATSCSPTLPTDTGPICGNAVPDCHKRALPCPSATANSPKPDAAIQTCLAKFSLCLQRHGLFLLEIILGAVPSRVGRLQFPSLWRASTQCSTHYGPRLQSVYLNIPPPLKVGKDQKSSIKYRVITSDCESTPNTVIAHAGSLTQVTLLLPGANNAHAITINS